MSSQSGAAPSPYVELDRSDWARLSNEHHIDLTANDVARLSSIHESLDLTEVEEVYLPISRLLTFYVKSMRDLHAVTSNFLGERPPPTPFIIGVAGSVAVGKSTTSRVLRELLSRWEESPRVQLVTTDGFLFPNHELERRDLLTRKGFPESYDRRALLRFVSAVKSGQEVVHAPVYSHLHYDIIPGATITVDRPDVLILEGLNVLQPPRKDAKGVRGLAISDFFDFSVYVDARVTDIRSWYVERFLALRDSAFANPHSYFHKFAGLTDETARGIALSLWESINYPNLRDNIVPTRRRASLVLTKGTDHSVRTVRLRKL